MSDVDAWVESGRLPCPHGRPFWGMCPHCNGMNEYAMKRDAQEHLKEQAKPAPLHSNKEKKPPKKKAPKATEIDK